MEDVITGSNVLAVIVLAGLIYGAKVVWWDKRKDRSAKGGSVSTKTPPTKRK